MERFCLKLLCPHFRVVGLTYKEKREKMHDEQTENDTKDKSDMYL